MAPSIITNRVFSRELSDDALGLILDVFLGASRPFSLFLTLEGGAISRVAANATAFPNRDALYWLAISGQWDDPALSEGQIRVMREQWLRLQPLTHGFYTNSAMNESDKRYKSNYGKNFERLTDLKNRYDPNNLFSSQCKCRTDNLTLVLLVRTTLKGKKAIKENFFAHSYLFFSSAYSEIFVHCSTVFL